MRGKENEREKDEEMVIKLSFLGSLEGVTLVVVKGLLRCISRRDRVPPSRMTGRILVSTGSGDLVSELLDFGRANFDLEAVSLFPDSLYEEGERSSDGCADELLLFSESGALPQKTTKGV